MASERFLLLNPRSSDLGTVVSSSEVASLPVANLLDMQPGNKFRSATTTSLFLTWTMAAALTADTLALIAHNLGPAATVRVRGAVLLANLTASPDIDTTTVSAWPATGKPTIALWPSFTSIVSLPAGPACAYWRIDISDAAATYIEIGRAMLGAKWQPSINFDMGGVPMSSFEPADVQVRTRYGRIFTNKRTDSAPRVFELQCFALTKREAFDGLYEIQRLRGLWGDVVCALDPGETTDHHRFVMQGVFAERGAYTIPPAFDASGNMFGAALRLNELIP